MLKKTKHLDLCCPTMTNCLNYFCYNMHQYSVFIISLMPWRCLYILYPLANRSHSWRNLSWYHLSQTVFNLNIQTLLGLHFTLLSSWLVYYSDDYDSPVWIHMVFFLLPSYKQLIRGNNDSSYCIKLLHKGRSTAST